MATLSSIGLKNPDWDLNKGKYEYVDELPMMASPGPVVMLVVTYLVFVLKVGPAYMQKREAFKLKYPLILYNAAQVAFSAFMVYTYWSNMMKYGMLHSRCLLESEPSRSELLLQIYIYFVAKVSELLDTVFFVVRKKQKQVTFLHVYHHAVMMLGTWAYLKYSPSDNVVFIGFMNSLVHVFMYSYYGLAAFGPNVAKYLWWKKYMTTFQLIQFASILVHYFATLCVSDCPPPRAVYTFFILNTLVFILLFANFYKKNYTARITNDCKKNGISSKSTNGHSNGVCYDESTKLKGL